MSQQRKTVTVVFADLVESTTTAEGLDPELWAGVLQRYFETLRAVVEKHGGTVEKFIGDAVVGIFGVPTLHEDDALRAIRAALEMHSALDALEAGLVIRVGANTGQVIASAQNAMGHAISMAARLEQSAPAGAVLIGADTFELVREFVDAQAVESLGVKGSTNPLAAWRVTGLRETTPRGSRAGTGYVGRASELDSIAAAFTRSITDQSCVMVTVTAPPGLGKSRLLAEAARSMSGEALVIGGRCLPYGESITYAPLVEAVKGLEAAAGEGVLDVLAARVSDGQQIIASVRATMSGAAHGSPDETAWAFRRLFDSLAEARPLVVLLDDLHWADPLLLDLIEYVATFSIGRPIVLLCAARPELYELRPSWATVGNASLHIRLAPLTAAETARLVAGLTIDRFDAQTRDQIVAASGGVPLFAEQMAALDAEQAGQNFVPPTIRALLAARIDRLTDDERAILELGAIEGEKFHRETVVALVDHGARSQAGARLMGVVRRELIRPETGPDGRDAFVFNHALIRDAVYEQMPRRLREELHERYAQLIETRPDAAPEVVGYHLDQAVRELAALGQRDAHADELKRRAGISLASAGRVALARKESSRGVDLLRRASELLAADQSERAKMLPRLIDALVAVADIDGAKEVRDEAVLACRALGDETSELRVELAWSVVDLRRDIPGWQQRILELSERALPRFAATGDEADIAQALLLQAVAVAQRDQTRGIEILKSAHVHAAASGDERIQMETWDELGGSMIFGPTPYEEVLEFVRGEAAWAREHGIAFANADGRLGEAYATAALGQFDEALAILRELIDFFSQLPEQVSQHGECYTLAGRIEHDRNDPEASLAQYRRAMDIFEAAGFRRWWRNAAPGAAHALIDLERLDEAREVIDELLARGEAGNVRAGAFQLEAQARYKVRIGEIEAGLDLARNAVAAVADSGALLYEGRARETLAGLLAATGNVDEAREEFGLARSLYVAKGYVPGIARLDRLTGQARGS